MNSNLGETILAGLDMNAKEVNLDGAAQWGGPSVEGQLNQDDTWELDGVQVDVLDLTSPDDINAYQELLKASMSKDPTIIIVEQDRQFCEDTSNWKVFVMSTKIRYKKLTGTSKK